MTVFERDKSGRREIYLCIGIHVLFGALLLSPVHRYYRLPDIIDVLWCVVVLLSWGLYWHPARKHAKDRIAIGESGITATHKALPQVLAWEDIAEIGVCLWRKPMLMRGENRYNASRLYLYCADHELSVVERCMVGTIWQYRLIHKGVIFFRCEGIFDDGTGKTIDIDAAIVNRMKIDFFDPKHFQKFPLEKVCIYADRAGEHSIDFIDGQWCCKEQKRHHWLLIISSPYVWLWIGILSVMLRWLF